MRGFFLQSCGDFYKMSRLKKVGIFVGVAATLVVLCWGMSHSYTAVFDDAYITYRYADNLRRGLGLVFNPGEWF